MEGKAALVSEGIVIASVTAYSYVLACLYEFGCAKYYGIPHNLIEVNLSNVVHILFILLSLGMFIGTAATIALLVAPEAVYSRIRTSGPLGFAVAVQFIVMYAYEFKLNMTIACGIMCGFFVVGQVVSGVIWKWVDKLPSKPADRLINKFVKRFEPLPIVAVKLSELVGIGPIALVTGLWCAVLLGGFAYLKGSADAEMQKNYLAVKGKEGYYVVRAYSKTLVCRKVDKGESRLLSGYMLLDEAAAAAYEFESEAIGPLKRK